MAERSNAASESRYVPPMNATKPPNLKDIQGFDSTVPRSHQWFMPKPGDSVPGFVSGELSPRVHHGKLGDDVSKALGNSENFSETDKKKDLLSPLFHDSESGRGDGWHDEERDTFSTIRHDRWREGDKEYGDTRKLEKRSDNSSKPSSEPRRISDRWTDSGSKDNNYERRRDNKWNTRWGPEDKQSETRREKWSDSGRDIDGFREKGMPVLTKESDREGESLSRSWRSSSYLSRGKGDAPHQTLTSSKQVSVFGYGRGRGENWGHVYPSGRGRGSLATGLVNNSAVGSNPLGASAKFEGARADHYIPRYNRMKLLDIYRLTEISHNRVKLEGFTEVPFITLVDPLEPLAFSAPTFEESVVFKGIDKGDIISSGGLPQVSKDGSTGRHPTDAGQSKHAKLDDGEDLDNVVDAYKDVTSNSPKEVSISSRRPDRGEDVGVIEVSSSNNSFSQRYPFNISQAGKNSVTDSGFKLRDRGWPHLQKGFDMEQTNNLAHSSYFDNGSNLPRIEGEPTTSNFPKTLDQESKEAASLHHADDLSVSMEGLASRKLQMQTSPEKLILYYRDPQGQVQGPFSGSDLIGWFEAGYFGIDLPVRPASAPSDAPFALLGDVMPHLKMKASPPPGFNMAKQNDILEKLKFGMPVDIHRTKSDFDVINGVNKIRYEAAGTDAENSFLESLMSGKVKGSAFSEGLQGHGGNYGRSLSVGGGDTENDTSYQLARKMSLDQNRGLVDPLSLWPGKDALPLGSKPEFLPDSNIPFKNPLLYAGDPHPIHNPMHRVDLLSMLKAGEEKSLQNLYHPDVRSQNAAAHGSGAVMQDKIDLSHNQKLAPQTVFGLQQGTLQPTHVHSNLQSQLMTQHTTETLISPEVSQDPRILGLLEQQLLLSQYQLLSQSSLPAQLSLADQLLLLKQQQQKQEQQQLLLQHQQHLLSQSLLGQRVHQQFGELSYVLPSAAIPSGIPSVDPILFHRKQDLPQINNQVPEFSLSNTNFQAPVDGTAALRFGFSPLHFPHQISGDPMLMKNWDAAPTSQGVESVPNSKLVEDLADGPSLAGTHKSEQIHLGSQKDDLENDTSEIQNKAPSVSGVVGAAEYPSKYSGVPVLSPPSSGQAYDLNISSKNISEQSENDLILGKSLKKEEVREAKKTSEKKSRKQKNVKAPPSLDIEKVSSKPVLSEQGKQDLPLYETTNAVMSKSEVIAVSESLDTPVYGGGETLVTVVSESLSLQEDEVKFNRDDAINFPSNISHRAWKPAPGLKPKSLLEIQLEEQRKRREQPVVVTEGSAAIITSSGFTAQSSSTASILDPNFGHNSKVSVSAQLVYPTSKKSQLHDLLAEEVLAKADEEEKDASCGVKDSLQIDSHVDVAFDDEFIEAKDTRKNRKKAAKAAKNTNVLKSSPPVSSSDVFVSPVSVEKGKPWQAQQEPELLSVPSSGLSFGDYVFWRGEQVNNNLPAQAAWSTDSGKVQKPASLRDIQKEQEKRAPVQQSPVTISTPKVQVSGSNLQISGSSPSKAAFIHSKGAPAQMKAKNEEDLFWGPVDQQKQETKQPDYPSLVKGTTTPAKAAATVFSSTNQKTPVVRAAENSFSWQGTAQSSKVKKGASAKLSEAVDFKKWCEDELFRLTGSSDTSLLEYCMKQPTSEAEMLLKENLGSLDRNHEFIDKFINYKDFLPANVLDMAFQSADPPQRAAAADHSRDAADVEIDTEDGSSKSGGGKKKGKKGKKVNPSVLGFSVVSNRIMMGEIQTIED